MPTSDFFAERCTTACKPSDTSKITRNSRCVSKSPGGLSQSHRPPTAQQHPQKKTGKKAMKAVYIKKCWKATQPPAEVNGRRSLPERAGGESGVYEKYYLFWEARSVSNDSI